MIKVLVTGAESYIGISFEKWMMQWPEKYTVETIDMKDSRWRDKDFSEFDVILHVAGIVHLKERKENQDLYYKVNRDLTYQVAFKAKEEGVKQFIFLSSMSVYGKEEGTINQKTQANPQNHYGKSKLQAEKLLEKLNDENLYVSIIRPPMIYGKGCKGNYQKLSRYAKRIPFFPDVQNARSMIYIENLCEFIRILIEDKAKGVFCPQNKEYVSTSKMVREIALNHGKKIRMIKFLNPIIILCIRRNVSIINKIFGNLTYSIEVSDYKEINYIVKDFNQSISETEK